MLPSVVAGTLASMAMDYESEAVVTVDGEEISVYAYLTVDHAARRWGGTLDSPDPALRFKMVAGQRSVLRLPSGKEASIVPDRDTGDGVTFQGSGMPPI
jgi:hypothetical protein